MSIWKRDCILLGHQGDNLQTDITVDVTPILVRWPNAYIEVAVLRPTESVPYMAVSHVADGRLVWHVTASDTAIVGYGQAEIIAYDDGKVAYSCPVITKIRPVMDGIAQSDPPEPAEAWVQQVVEAGAAAEEALETAQALVPAVEEALAAAQHAEETTESLALLAQQSADEAEASAGAAAGSASAAAGSVTDAAAEAQAAAAHAAAAEASASAADDSKDLAAGSAAAAEESAEDAAEASAAASGYADDAAASAADAQAAAASLEPATVDDVTSYLGI